MNLKKTFGQVYNANVKVINSIIRSKRIHSNRKINYETLYDEVHNNAAPCFVLSTGRCGTHLLTKLLSKHKSFDIYHTPIPELVYYSKYAFDNSGSKFVEIEKIVDAARYEYIRDTYLLDLQFVETNNRITFFANQLAHLYPKAKFIHLVRDPVAFVKSGLNRNWYSGKSNHDEGRIKMESEKWNKFSDVYKIAWLWNATNQFIENFKANIAEDRVITIKSEELFSDHEKAVSIFEFLSYNPLNEATIKSIIKKPTNVGRGKKRITISDEIISEIYSVTELAKKYNYFQ